MLLSYGPHGGQSTIHGDTEIDQCAFERIFIAPSLLLMCKTNIPFSCHEELPSSSSVLALFSLRFHSSFVQWSPYPNDPMKKVSLLLGALGGAMAGYVFSNQKLRNELSEAKDAEAAAQILGKHMKSDGQKIGKEVWDFVQSDEVQKNMKKAKKYAEQQFKTAKGEVQKYMKKETKQLQSAAKAAAKKAVKRAKTGFKGSKV